MVQRYNILGKDTNQYLCLCSHAWPVEVSHGKIRVRHQDDTIQDFVNSIKQFDIETIAKVFSYVENNIHG